MERIELNAGVTAGLIELGRAGRRRRCISATWAVVSPTNGGRPVTIS